MCLFVRYNCSDLIRREGYFISIAGQAATRLVVGKKEDDIWLLVICREQAGEKEECFHFFFVI